MKIRRFYFAFAFVMERQINSPDFLSHLFSQWSCWASTSHNNRPHLRKQNKIPEILFRFHFRNSTERKSKILGLSSIFACNCFCEDGSGTLNAGNWSFGEFLLVFQGFQGSARWGKSLEFLSLVGKELRPLPVNFTTKLPIVRPFWVLHKDAIGP